jgi:transcriptional regulator with XRE-family HTH domain
MEDVPMSTENAINIKILLLKKKVKQRTIAKAQGVSEPTISRIIAGKRKTPRLREAIAQACGAQVEELWPANTA